MSYRIIQKVMSRNQKEKRKERKYILVEKRGRKLDCSKTDSLFDLRGEFDGYVTNSSPSLTPVHQSYTDLNL